MSLMQRVTAALESVLEDGKISVREVPLVRFQQKISQEMLKISDLDLADGAAGESLISEGMPDEMEDVDEVGQDDDATTTRQEKILIYRNQNIKALEMAGQSAPRTLWVIGGTPEEQSTIGKSVKQLFGEAITINNESLPNGTHGLRSDLDGADLPARGRFEKRVEHWTPAAEQIKAKSNGKPIIALICASDKYNNRAEDPVNYYAGIHVMSSIGANVHHVLPTENPLDVTSKQDFLHRAQSALLDVFLAHSGIVFGVRNFLSRLLPEESIPKAIYGIQAIRSKARSRSGETGVSFFLYSRLNTDSGITEIQIVHRAKSGNKRSPWMHLAKGLQWIGNQRQLHEGDERWLRDSFVDETRDTLGEIANTDPKAIVLIDWSSVAGLWNGIRDEDLISGNEPKLGEVALSAFKQMSLVPLRRGSNTRPCARPCARLMKAGAKAKDARARERSL